MNTYKSFLKALELTAKVAPPLVLILSRVKPTPTIQAAIRLVQMVRRGMAEQSRKNAPAYWTVDQLLEWITDDKNRKACQRIYDEHRLLFEQVQGSTHNHQTWPGGYIDHVQEVLNIAVALFEVMSRLRRLPFTLSDALLVLFLHDLEKPWSFAQTADGSMVRIPELRDKAKMHEFRMDKLKEYGITLTPAQLNALTYVEGEYKDYSSKHRVSNELAAFCHLCDTASARIWYDHPKAADDPWPGAGRFREPPRNR